MLILPITFWKIKIPSLTNIDRTSGSLTVGSTLNPDYPGVLSWDHKNQKLNWIWIWMIFCIIFISEANSIVIPKSSCHHLTKLKNLHINLISLMSMTQHIFQLSLLANLEVVMIYWLLTNGFFYTMDFLHLLDFNEWIFRNVFIIMLACI